VHAHNFTNLTDIQLDAADLVGIIQTPVSHDLCWDAASVLYNPNVNTSCNANRVRRTLGHSMAAMNRGTTDEYIRRSHGDSSSAWLNANQDADPAGVQLVAATLSSAVIEATVLSWQLLLGRQGYEGTIAWNVKCKVDAKLNQDVAGVNQLNPFQLGQKNLCCWSIGAGLVKSRCWDLVKAKNTGASGLVHTNLLLGRRVTVSIKSSHVFCSTIPIRIAYAMQSLVGSTTLLVSSSWCSLWLVTLL
jgi:hypothetical protein